jgi:polyhydroxybutyrate depolymerase
MNLRPLLSLPLAALSVCVACSSDPSAQGDGDEIADEDLGAVLDGGGPRGSVPRDATVRDAARDGGDARVVDARAADARVRDARAPSDDEPPIEVVKKGRSAGCGKSGRGTGKYETARLKVDERDRGYALFVPSKYDAQRAYPVIVRLHGTGGDGLSGGMDIQLQSGQDAIIISPDGIDKGFTDTTEASDLKFFDSLLSTVGDSYCVDLDNVFAYGFSAGAGLAELLACKRGGALRGIAAIAGFPRGNGAGCQGPVAAWLAHDKDDEAVPLIGGTLARGRILQQNSCSATTMPDAPDCVRYTGCTEGYPVVWCESAGLGHNIRGDYAPKAVWDFFSSL